jgi:hypothetical protein
MPAHRPSAAEACCSSRSTAAVSVANGVDRAELRHFEIRVLEIQVQWFVGSGSQRSGIDRLLTREVKFQEPEMVEVEGRGADIGCAGTASPSEKASWGDAAPRADSPSRSRA